jgi:hypothetical protein
MAWHDTGHVAPLSDTLPVSAVMTARLFAAPPGDAFAADVAGQAARAVWAANQRTLSVDIPALVWAAVARTLTADPGAAAHVATQAAIAALPAAPPSAEVAAEVLATLQATELPVNVMKMNGADVIGTGAEVDPWRGAGVSP